MTNTSVDTSDVVGKVESRAGAQLEETWRRFRKSRTAMLGLVIIAVIVLMAAFADVIAPYERAIAQDYDALLQPPSSTYIFGTDHLGRDVFARVVHGARNSLSIGLSTTLIAYFLGTVLGGLCGYYGGRFDDIVMRVMDMLMCIPGILLALAIVAALGASMVNLLIAITISTVPSCTRIVRSFIISLSEQDFVEAARAYGATDARIIFRHIIPNAMGPLIVSTTMSISGMILAAAGLSFVGMGIQPPAPEWGSMLAGARAYLRQAGYLVIFPGVAILLSALSFNLVGDGLRDALDPRLRD